MSGGANQEATLSVDSFHLAREVRMSHQTGGGSQDPRHPSVEEWQASHSWFAVDTLM